MKKPLAGLILMLTVIRAWSVPATSYSPTPTPPSVTPEDVARVWFIGTTYEAYWKERGQTRILSSKRAASYYQAADKVCRQRLMDVDWYLALLAAESGFSNLPLRPKDGCGVPQLTPGTARGFKKSWRFWDDGRIARYLLDNPKETIGIAGLYLSECLDKSGGDYAAAVIRYNGGLSCSIHSSRAVRHLARVRAAKGRLDQRIAFARAVHKATKEGR